MKTINIEEILQEEIDASIYGILTPETARRAMNEACKQVIELCADNSYNDHVNLRNQILKTKDQVK